MSVMDNPVTEVPSVLHSIYGYDRQSDELVSETKIPRFLDLLAVKFVETGEDDPNAILSYELTTRQLYLFTFLTGLQPNVSDVSYFLETN